MAPAKIIAAGGVVFRGRRRPLIAIVQLRRTGAWVLPKGKLHRGESAIEAAKREVLEEAGRHTDVFEFLGAISYVRSGLPKRANYWRMQAKGKPQKLMRDVRAVRWLPLDQAVGLLTHEREKNFLRRVGPRALAAAMQLPRVSLLQRIANWFRKNFLPHR